MFRLIVLIFISYFYLFLNFSLAGVVHYPCGPSNYQQKMCDYLDKRFSEENPGNTSNRINIPWSSSKQLMVFRQMFAGKSDYLDVVNLDITWNNLLFKNLYDLTPYVKKSVKYFDMYDYNNRLNGKILALPLFIDTSYLYYRKDLLQKYSKNVPKTWDELYNTALEIQTQERLLGNKNIWGFIFQAKKYEGLTCNFIEWISSYGGGSVIDHKGNVTINNTNAIKALDKISSFINTITPINVLNYMEEDSRSMFQNGNAVFMRNWTYVWNLLQKENNPLKDKVGFASLPKGSTIKSKSRSVIGGWSYAVNKYSRNPSLAAKFVVMATDKKSQIERFKIEGQTPAIPELFKKPELKEITSTLNIYNNAVLRPSFGINHDYSLTSKYIYDIAYMVLSGRVSGAEATAQLEGELNLVLGN